MKYDEEALGNIPLDSVFTALNLPMIRNKFTCPYPHKKPRPVSIYTTENICKCHNCDEFKGGVIATTMYVRGEGFMETCEWLHNAFNIPFLNGEQNKEAKARIIKPNKSEVEYMLFDETIKYSSITLRDHFKDYAKMTIAQKLKFIYTYLYRYSIRGEQKAKFAYYTKERGIPSNNSYIQAIGYLNQKQLKNIVSQMKKLFPEEDLLEVGILKKNDKGEINFVFHYVNKGGLLFVPSFDLYTNMVTGFMVRPTHPPKWMQREKLKELQLSKRHIVLPLPFGLTYKRLKNSSEFFFTEGHPDLASIPGNTDGNITRAGVASPGTYGFTDEMLGLFRGKKIVLVYDQDFSGQKAEFGYNVLAIGKDIREEYLTTVAGTKTLKERKRELTEKGVEFKTQFYKGVKQRLVLAGVKDVSVLKWDKTLGGDINDLVINCNIDKVFPEGVANES
jgi:DNA primase